MKPPGLGFRIQGLGSRFDILNDLDGSSSGSIIRHAVMQSPSHRISRHTSREREVSVASASCTKTSPRRVAATRLWLRVRRHGCDANWLRRRRASSWYHAVTRRRVGRRRKSSDLCSFDTHAIRKGERTTTD